MKSFRVVPALFFALTGATAVAQEAGAPPMCEARTEGQLVCQANRQCACVHAQAVPARNLPERWHWDCGITRPACTTVPESLAPLPHGSGNLPVIVDVDDDRHESRDRRRDNRPPPDRDPPRT